MPNLWENSERKKERMVLTTQKEQLRVFRIIPKRFYQLCTKNLFLLCIAIFICDSSCTENQPNNLTWDVLCWFFFVSNTCKKNLTDFVLNFLTLWVLWSVLPIPLDHVLSAAETNPLLVIVSLIVWTHNVWSLLKSFGILCLIDSSNMKFGWFCSFSFLRSSYNYFLFMNVIGSSKFVSIFAFNVLNFF